MIRPRTLRPAFLPLALGGALLGVTTCGYADDSPAAQTTSPAILLGPLFNPLRWQAHYSVLPHLVMLKTSQRASKAHLIFFLAPSLMTFRAPNCSRIRKPSRMPSPKATR